MHERKRYLHGVPCWIDLDTPDPEGAAAYLTAVLGWDVTRRGGPDGPYLVATLHGRAVAAIATRPAAGGAVWNTYVAVDDLDDAVARVAAAGGRVLGPGVDLGDLARTARVADPQGAAFRLWEAGTLAGAVLVNEPGTWNSSDLVTTDVAGAADFYGEVFGWVADTVGEGGWSATMLRLPGYGDHLAETDPGIRERHADPGVPPGFSDAIGWLEEADPTAGEPAHWRVTLAVEDPDDVARRAEAAGGTVVVPPTDAPPVRFAVLADPAGAVTTVSSYRPGELSIAGDG